jgi:uncharacterized protein YdbL (DUF1318 family)
MKGDTMRKKIKAFICFGWLLSLLVSCLTINIYFPEATVKRTADEIVEEVRGTKKEDKAKKEKNLSTPSFSLVPFAYAQEQEEEKVTTPKIRALKESLKERFPSLVSYFDAGNIGEGIDGYLHIINEENLSLKQKADLRQLVKDENNDRENLYTEVAKALEIDPSQIPRIQKIFAQSWIKNARPGWWIQNEAGEWMRKSEETLG